MLPKTKTIAALAAAALGLTLLAAGCGAQPDYDAADLGGGGPAANACASPHLGCPCDAPNTVVDCGKVEKRYSDYVVCSMGKRACDSNGVWGACVGENGASVDSTNALHFMNLGTSPGSCAGLAGANACDPAVCNVYTDDTTGMTDAGPHFNVEGGLTPLPEGGSTVTTTTTSTGGTYTTPNGNNSCGGTPGDLSTSTSACTAATQYTTAICKEDFHCNTTTNKCEWSQGSGYKDANCSGVDLTVGDACTSGTSTFVPICNRGLSSVPAGTNIALNFVSPASIPDLTALITGTPDCTYTVSSIGLGPGQCVDVDTAACGSVPGNNYVVINGNHAVTECTAAGGYLNNAAFAKTAGGCAVCGSTPTPAQAICTPACTGGSNCTFDSNGLSVCQCPPYQSTCSGSCVDTYDDRTHCGSSCTACGTGQACVAGACVSSCPTGLTLCNGECVDTMTDSDNCGGCGTVCASGTGCVQTAAAAASCKAEAAPCEGTLTGTIKDPANVNPLPGVSVYVPTTTVSALSSLQDATAYTVSCEQCSNLISGNPYYIATTASDGTFSLGHVPATGSAFNLVIQSGRWRRQVTVPANAFTACGQTVNLNSTTGGSAKAHLPSLHRKGVTGTDEATDVADPDMPQMALVTGNGDQLECLLKRIGINAAYNVSTLANSGSTGEFTNPVKPSSGVQSGRVHFYQTTNGTAATGYIGSAASTPDDTVLFNNPTTPSASAPAFNNYQLVIEPCHNQTNTAMTATQVTNHVNFANSGGRLFMSHRLGPDVVYASNTNVGTATGNWRSTVTWISDGIFPTAGTGGIDASDRSDSATFRAHVAQTPVGGPTQIFANWLVASGATTAANIGTVDVYRYRRDIVNVNTTSPYATTEWAWGDSANNTLDTVGSPPAATKQYLLNGQPPSGGNATSGSPSQAGRLSNIVTFDTPIGKPGGNYCGRVVLPMMHVTSVTPGAFPGECSSLGATLTPQEKAFEYMFFQATACVGTPSTPVAPTCANNPIMVGSVCAATLAQADFTNGVCSCSAVTTTNQVATDAYKSASGTYTGNACTSTTATGCGGVGVNGACTFNSTTSPSISTTGSLNCSGGAIASNKTLTVSQNLSSNGNITAATGSTVGDATCTVGSAACGKSTFPSTATISTNITSKNGTATQPATIPDACNCSSPAGATIATEIANHATSNDNATISLSSNILTATTGNLRLDLPCGNFYLSGDISNSGPVTIAATGRVGLWINGDVKPTAPLVFTLTAGAELDVFVKGVVTPTNVFKVGTPNYPSMMRMWVANNANATNAMDLSGATSISLAGGFWLNGSLKTSTTATTIYGSLFAKNLTSLASNLTVHYDTSVQTVANPYGQCSTPSITSTSTTAGPTTFAPQTYTRDFHATCSPGYKVQWQLFEWQATVPSTSSIVFTAQTADDNGSGSPGTFGAAVSAGTASSTTTGWTYDANTVHWHLGNDDPPNAQTDKEWLRVSMTFNPNSTATAAPTLTDWRQLYDCVAAE